jgi:ABC-type glycerol-3-phosphate transport system permease component
VAIPFYVMVMTSLKTQGELIANPLDFSIDLSQGWALFRSYEELFRDFNFGSYMWTSFYVSVLTVLITLFSRSRAPTRWRGCGSGGRGSSRARSCSSTWCR